MITKLEVIALEKVGLGLKEGGASNLHQDHHPLLWWMSPLCTARIMLRRRWCSGCFLITSSTSLQR